MLFSRQAHNIHPQHIDLRALRPPPNIVETWIDQFSDLRYSSGQLSPPPPTVHSYDTAPLRGLMSLAFCWRNIMLLKCGVMCFQLWLEMGRITGAEDADGFRDACSRRLDTWLDRVKEKTECQSGR